MKKKTPFLILFVIAVFSVIIRLPILLEPWGADQAGYGYIGKGILEGKVPYKDLYCLTGYGIFFTYAFFFKLFGTHMISIHIGHIIVSTCTIILVFFLSKRVFGLIPAIISTVIFSIFSNGMGFSAFGYENKSAWGTYWYLAQREVFMAPPLMGAIYLTIMAEERNRKVLYWIAGGLIGLAAIYKVTAFLLIIFLVLFLSWSYFSEKARPSIVIVKVFYLISGFFLIQLPFFFYFWINDAMGDVYQALYVHLSSYVKLSRGNHLEALFSGHLPIVSENLILWIIAPIASLYIINRERSKDRLLIILWALCSLVMVWGQGKFFGYHFIILMPPLAILTGYGLCSLLFTGSAIDQKVSWNREFFQKVIIVATITLNLLAFSIINYDYYRWHILYISGKISQSEYYQVFTEYPTHIYSFRSDLQVANYLKRNANTGEETLRCIFEGGETVIHFLTGMESPTRFIQTWYLFNEQLNDHSTMKLRNEFINDLIDKGPTYLLFVYFSPEQLKSLPYLNGDPSIKKFFSFFENNYQLAKIFPDNRFLYKKI